MRCLTSPTQARSKIIMFYKGPIFVNLRKIHSQTVEDFAKNGKNSSLPESLYWIWGSIVYVGQLEDGMATAASKEKTAAFWFKTAALRFKAAAFSVQNRGFSVRSCGFSVQSR